MNDATALSTVLGSGSAISSSASVANGYSPSDRQSRRKADSVCRGLTELCLALSDDHLKQQQRPPSQDDTIKAQPNGNTEEPSTPIHPFQRSSSFEPEGVARRRSSTRVVSRLEARRASLANSSPANKDDPPPVPTQQLPSQAQPQSQPPEPQSATPARARINRLSTSIRTRRPDDENPEKGTPHNRTLSRAMTDIATPASNRLSTRQRFSHGYMPSQSIPNSPQEQSYTPKTPQHPPSQLSQPPQSQQQQQQSSQPPRTPSISQSGIPLRRSFMAPVTYTPYNPHTPATSRSNIQAGSRRYGSSFSSGTTANGPMTGNTTNIPETPQPTTPSQTRIVAPSTKLAGSYTPIQQNRTRTNSLGTRRFGIRPRPTVNVDNTINDRLS